MPASKRIVASTAAVQPSETVDIHIGATLARAAAVLAGSSPSARVDAEALLTHVTGFDRAQLIARSLTALSHEQLLRWHTLVERRRRGEPVAYLTGRREFWSLTLKVSPATLIPRPETEVLVEQALACIPPNAESAIADVGTGSGAIALALACERPICRIVATDICRSALRVARENARRFGFAQIEFRQGRWFAPLVGQRFNLIVSNPPYVRRDDPHLRRGDVRFEPRRALAAGATGLAALHHLIAHARQYLRPDGWLVLEHAPEQACTVRRCLREHDYVEIGGERDLAGRERVSRACLRVG